MMIRTQSRLPCRDIQLGEAVFLKNPVEFCLINKIKKLSGSEQSYIQGFGLNINLLFYQSLKAVECVLADG
ncbi:MAG: hypothetical protein ACI9B7_001335 [Oleispira sp.]|jgi:hypothetical protein